jgi:hypothetical protein
MQRKYISILSNFDFDSVSQVVVVVVEVCDVSFRSRAEESDFIH